MSNVEIILSETYGNFIYLSIMQNRHLTDEMNMQQTSEQTPHISPKWIRSLNENEIFVFGSNLAGFHGGGAAELAMEWGAAWGQGVGLQGKTYAIRTMFKTAEEMKPYIDDFLAFAKSHSELKFLVTEIGCGIAGFTPKDIAPFFKAVIDDEIENVYLPGTFFSVF
jgi:hypothetical protein